MALNTGRPGPQQTTEDCDSGDAGVTDAGSADGVAPGPGGRNASHDAAESVIIRTAAVWCGVWILGTVPALASDESGQIHTGLGYLVLAMLTVAWFACLVVRRLPPWVLVVAAAVAALVAAANTAPLSLSLPYAAAVPITNLAVCMVAVLLPGRAGMWAALSIGLLALALVIAAAAMSGVLGLAWRGCLVFGVYPLGVGLSAFGTVGALRAVAAADDAATEERLAALVAETSERASRNERFRVARMLHDTVVNTFGAIANGASGARADLVRQRCERDLSVLRRAADPMRSTDNDHGATSSERVVCDVVAAAHRQARLLNLTLTVNADSHEITASQSVVEAVVGALDEALLNAAKHSGTKTVELRLSATPTAFDIEVSDHGRGLLAVARTDQSALASITTRCTHAGVDTEVMPALDGGTTVRLSWRHNAVDGLQTGPITPRSVLLKSLPLVARWVTGWFSAIFAVEVIVSWGSGTTLGELVALLLLVLSAGVAIRRGFVRLPIPWAASLSLAIAAGLITFAPTAQLAGCDRLGLQYWGSMGGTVCVILIILLFGSTVWIVLGSAALLLGIAALVAQPGSGPGLSTCTVGSLPSLLLTALALVIAMILFRRLLVSYGERASASQRSAGRVMARVASMREQERVRGNQLQSVLADIDPLLAGLASGELDPGDPQVQSRCRDAEDYLRSLIRIDPNLGSLGEAMARAVVLAHANGATLTVRSAEQVRWPEATVLTNIETLLAEVSHRLRPGQQGWLTLLPRVAGASLAVLIPLTAAPDEATLEAMRANGGDTGEATGKSPELPELPELLCVPEGSEVLIELSWRQPA